MTILTGLAVIFTVTDGLILEKTGKKLTMAHKSMTFGWATVRVACQYNLFF
ncbi:hypothetical protein ACUIJQ_00315 [Levilactobacillus hammesii]|uniref:Uncharacterized protein n=1 Tax=Levilactobacillus hammesii DSM 16381 TaxID=1423753 RepID=A0A0R1UU23_9LACO|nr:hypothetical protein [Levilactobacillus hammesii]KRL94437.1 hypothetical protein FD28_GL000589 [Levilactobacillus hammesii DSM 16381]